MDEMKRLELFVPMATHTPNGMTVANLKAIIKDWPDVDADGNQLEVWIGGDGVSNQAKVAWPLHLRTSEGGGQQFADLLLEP